VRGPVLVGGPRHARSQPWGPGSVLNCAKVKTFPPCSNVALESRGSSVTRVSPALIAVSAIRASRDWFKGLILFVQHAYAPQQCLVETIVGRPLCLVPFRIVPHGRVRGEGRRRDVGEDLQKICSRSALVVRSGVRPSSSSWTCVEQILRPRNTALGKRFSFTWLNTVVSSM
jgi:hypothetical protein